MLRNTLMAPVRLLTATRNAWTLNATERGVPFHFPLAVRRRPRAAAAAASSASATRLPPLDAAPATSDHAPLAPPACSAAKLKISSRKAFAGELRGAAGDDGAGAAIGAGVVAAIVGVGGENDDAVGRRAERGRRDLMMHRGGAVAELGGADDQLVAAVVAQADAGVGEVAERRHGVDHAERDALADQPVVGRRRLDPAAAIERVLDQSETLVEAVAAVLARRGLPPRRSRPSGRRAGPCCARGTRTGRCRAGAPVRPSRIRPRNWSAAGRSREKRRSARCWCRRQSRRSSCWRSGRRRSSRRRRG